MNQIDELLRTSLGARLGRAVGLRLVHSDYGRYYLAGYRSGSFYFPGETHAEYLEETLELCRKASLTSDAWRATRDAPVSKQTLYAAELAQGMWPTQNGLVRLGIAQRAAGQNLRAKLSLMRAANASPGRPVGVAGLLALANLLLEEGANEGALALSLRAAHEGGPSAATSITTLLASSKAGKIQTLQRAAYEIDESGQDLDESIEIMTEQRARRVRDGLQEALCPTRSVRMACRYAGPRARRVLGWS